MKYLKFVSGECNRYLKDQNISDEELQHLIIELERFKSKVNSSELKAEIKSQINDIHLNYTREKIKRNGIFLFIAFITFGAYAHIFNARQQAKRNEALLGLKFDTDRLIQSMMLDD